MSKTTERHHLVVRISLRVNALALVGGGLRIFNAYPGCRSRGRPSSSPNRTERLTKIRS
jgi:hypothetical protein